MDENKNTEAMMAQEQDGGEETIRQEPETAALPFPTPAPQRNQEKEKDPPTLVRFSKPYNFEGRTYTEIDLAGIEGLTARDMTEAEKYLARNNQVSPLPEMTIAYACYIASLSTEQPIEFFQGLPTKDAVKVKNRVTSFFYGED